MLPRKPTTSREVEDLAHRTVKKVLKKAILGKESKPKKAPKN